MDLNFVLQDDVLAILLQMKDCRDSMLSSDVGPKQAAEDYLRLVGLTDHLSTMLHSHKESVRQLAWNKGA